MALSKILDTLRKDPALRTRLGADASEDVRTKNSWANTVQKVLTRTGISLDDGQKSYATASA